MGLRGPKFKLNSGKLISAYYEAGSVKGACEKLGIAKKTFYDSMKRLGLEFSTKIIPTKSLTNNNR